MNIKPLNEYLVIEILKNEKEGGENNVILPETHQKEEFGVGKVIAIDKQIGEFADIEVGDKVVFDKDLVINVKIEIDELKFLKFSDVLGVINNRVEQQGV